MMPPTRSPRALAMLIAALPLLTCGDEVTLVPQDLASFITAITTSDRARTASLLPGAAPDASGGPEVVNIRGASVFRGAETLFTVFGGSEFTSVIVFVANRRSYYQITLPGAVTSTDLLMSFGEAIPDESFTIVFGLLDSQGRIGTYAAEDLEVTPGEPPALPGDYERCNATLGCEGAATCFLLTGMEPVPARFCAPACGTGQSCPDLSPATGFCGLAEGGGTTATHCVLQCNPADSGSCPASMQCAATGDTGICVHPPS